MRLDDIDQKLLGLLQTSFPLTSQPYAVLGLDINITEEKVIKRIEQMKLNGLVRQISPVLDARRLGYKTTLVSMRVAKTELDQAANFLNDHPRVSHAYEREHHFNLWFTLSASDTVDLDAELPLIADTIKAESFFYLPMVRAFKLRTYFSSDEDNQPVIPEGIPNSAPSQRVPLSRMEAKIINELQQDLPLISRPFTEMSTRLGIDEVRFLAQCRSLLSRGIIRRYGAAVNHRGAGFNANAMTCWAVPKGKVEAIAEKLVPLRQVSHCYERITNPEWHYNLFAMIHGRTRDFCQRIADKISAETDLKDCVLLFSTREFKKTRVIYKV